MKAIRKGKQKGLCTMQIWGKIEFKVERGSFHNDKSFHFQGKHKESKCI